jgi:hypothetical protein
MWIARLTRSITEFSLSPLSRALLLAIYYGAIIVGLVVLYGKGQLTPTKFIYQGF